MTNSEQQSLPEAFKSAGQGVAEALKERNMRIHLCFAALAIVLGIALKIDLHSWLAVVICIGVVLSLEMVNSAIEAVVDLASPDYHALARKAKDCAAGAVLVSAIAAVVVAAIVYLPAIMNLIQG